MAQPAPAHPRPIVAPAGTGTVAAGGPIADLQRTLEERLIDAQAVAAMPAWIERGGPHPLSRIAGPTLLAAAYSVLAIWWF